MYAIINKRTRKWLFGTDYRVRPPRQRTSTQRAILFDDEESAEIEMMSRRVGKGYRVVKVKLEVDDGR